MIDEPDNWRSIGEVLAGMLKRGDPLFAPLDENEANPLDNLPSFCDRQDERSAMTNDSQSEPDTVREIVSAFLRDSTKSVEDSVTSLRARFPELLSPSASEDIPDQNKPLSDMTPEDIAKLTPEQVDESDGSETEPTTDSLISQRIEKHRGLLEKLS